jgi:5'-3' exonuclease
MILIDGSGLTYKMFHAASKEIIQNGEFQFNYFKHILLSAILWKAKLLGASKHNKLVICSDSKPYWRYGYWESVKEEYFRDYYLTENTKKEVDVAGWTYKGKRPKLEWAKQIWQVHEEIIEFITNHTDYIEIKVPGAEADDVIGVLSQHFSATEEIFIATGDKDMQQLLVNPRIHIYNDNPHKKPSAPDFVECADPKRFLDEMILKGDTGDNIPNVKPKIGDKTATKLIAEKTLLEEMIQLNPTIEFRMKVNRKMISFDEIPTDISEAIIAKYNEKKDIGSFDEMEIIEYLMQHSLGDLQSRRQEFELKPHRVETRLNTYFTKKKKNVEYLNRQNDLLLEDLFN